MTYGCSHQNTGPWSGCICTTSRTVGTAIQIDWHGMTSIDVTSPTLPQMADAPPDHETIERVVRTEPLRLLDRLPDCTETRRAKQIVDDVWMYAKEAREKVRPEPAG